MEFQEDLAEGEIYQRYIRQRMQQKILDEILQIYSIYSDVSKINQLICNERTRKEFEEKYQMSVITLSVIFFLEKNCTIWLECLRNSKYINERNNEGNSILHMFCFYANWSNMKKLNYLLGFETDLFALNKDKKLAVNYAVSKLKETILDAMLKKLENDGCLSNLEFEDLIHIMNALSSLAYRGLMLKIIIKFLNLWNNEDEFRLLLQHFVMNILETLDELMIIRKELSCERWNSDFISWVTVMSKKHINCSQNFFTNESYCQLLEKDCQMSVPFIAMTVYLKYGIWKWLKHLNQVNHGKYLNNVNGNGDSALHMFCKSNPNFEAMVVMLSYKFNPFILNNLDELPVNLVTGKSRTVLIDFMINLLEKNERILQKFDNEKIQALVITLEDKVYKNLVAKLIVNYMNSRKNIENIIQLIKYCFEVRNFKVQNNQDLNLNLPYKKWINIVDKMVELKSWNLLEIFCLDLKLNTCLSKDAFQHLKYVDVMDCIKWKANCQWINRLNLLFFFVKHGVDMSEIWDENKFVNILEQLKCYAKEALRHIDGIPIIHILVKLGIEFKDMHILEVVLELAECYHLFDERINIEEKNANGDTALIFCLKGEETKQLSIAVETLLKYGASVQATNQIGKSCEELIKKRKKGDTRKYLVKKALKKLKIPTTKNEKTSHPIILPKNNKLLTKIDDLISEIDTTIHQPTKHQSKSNDNPQEEVSDEIIIDRKKLKSSLFEENAKTVDGHHVHNWKKNFRNLQFEMECTKWFVDSMQKNMLSCCEKYKIAEIIFKLAKHGIGNDDKRNCSQEIIHLIKIPKDLVMFVQETIMFSSRCSELDESSSTALVYVNGLRIWDISNEAEIDNCLKIIEDSLKLGHKSRVKETVKVSADKYLACDVDEPDRIILHPICDGTFSPVILHNVNSHFIKVMLQENQSCIDLPLKLSVNEFRVINSKKKKCKSTLLLGRSGTGKTTCLLYKMIMDFWECPTRKLIDDNGNEDPLKQIFITRNPFLCYQVQKIYSRLIFDINQLDDDYGQAEQIDLINVHTISEIDSKEYPLFLTYNEWLILLDGYLDEPFFKRKNGKLIHAMKDWLRPKHDLSILTLIGNNSSEEVVESTEMTYELFVDQIWPKMHTKYKTTFHSELVWTEIISFIKGSIEAMETKNGFLSLETYLDIGNKRAPSYKDHRQTIYKMFKCYNKFLRENYMFDRCDIIYHLYNNLELEIRFSPNYIYVDEVQDFTDAELSLFVRICSNPNNIFLTGDTAQNVMKGVSFRFEDLRTIFYKFHKRNPEIEIPEKNEIKQLKINYRSHDGILKLASSVLDILSNFFPESFDKMDPDRGLFLGPKPTLIESLQVEDLLNYLSGNKTQVSSIEFGANQAILVLNETRKKEIKKHITGIVLTIYESKGLEFNDILLYNFFADSKISTEWRHVSAFDSESSGIDALSADTSEYRILVPELKLLYTALTRAKFNIWIFDDNQAKRTPMYEYFRRRNLVESGSPVNLFTTQSTPEEWESRGDNFLNLKLYEHAYHAYEIAGKKIKMQLAQSYIQYMKAKEIGNKSERCTKYVEVADKFLALNKYMEAVNCLNFAGEYRRAAKILERINKIQDAVRMYLSANDLEQAKRCYVENGYHIEAVKLLTDHKRYDQAIEVMITNENHWSNITEYYQELAVNYKLAKKFKESAKYYELVQDFENCFNTLKSNGMFSEALEVYERNLEKLKSNEFKDLTEKAAKLYKEHGSEVLAAKCYQRLRLFGDAIDILYEAKLYKEAIDCYKCYESCFNPISKPKITQNKLIREKFAKTKHKNYTEIKEMAANLNLSDQVEIYEENEMFSNLAETYIQLEQPEKAKEIMLSNKMWEKLILLEVQIEDQDKLIYLLNAANCREDKDITCLKYIEEALKLATEESVEHVTALLCKVNFLEGKDKKDLLEKLIDICIKNRYDFYHVLCMEIRIGLFIWDDWQIILKMMKNCIKLDKVKNHSILDIEFCKKCYDDGILDFLSEDVNIEWKDMKCVDILCKFNKVIFRKCIDSFVTTIHEIEGLNNDSLLKEIVSCLCELITVFGNVEYDSYYDSLANCLFQILFPPISRYPYVPMVDDLLQQTLKLPLINSYHQNQPIDINNFITKVLLDIFLGNDIAKNSKKYTSSWLNFSNVFFDSRKPITDKLKDISDIFKIKELLPVNKFLCLQNFTLMYSISAYSAGKHLIYFPKSYLYFMEWYKYAKYQHTSIKWLARDSRSGLPKKMKEMVRTSEDFIKNVQYCQSKECIDYSLIIEKLILILFIIINSDEKIFSKSLRKLLLIYLDMFRRIMSKCIDSTHKLVNEDLVEDLKNMTSRKKCQEILQKILKFKDDVLVCRSRPYSLAVNFEVPITYDDENFYIKHKD